MSSSPYPLSMDRNGDLPGWTAREHPRMNSRESTQQKAGLPHMKGAPPASLFAWLWCPVTHRLVDMEHLALQVGSAGILGAGKCHCACSCPGLALGGPECSVRWDLASPSRQPEEATTHMPVGDTGTQGAASTPALWLHTPLGCGMMPPCVRPGLPRRQD